MSQPQPFEASKSGLNPILKTILWIVGIFGVLLFIGFLLEDPYPNSREEMVQFATNKCWKYEEIEINAIEYDGKVISKPSSDIRSTIRKAATGSNDELVWQNLENAYIKFLTDNSAFIFFRQLSSGGFTYYSQSTDEDLRRPTYRYGDITISEIDGKYHYDLKNISEDYTFDDKLVESGAVFESHHAKIVGLSNEMLRIEETIKGTVDGTSFSITTTAKYKVISESILDTRNLKRIIENSGQ
jgi:hypothetical protein